ncbi:hypothetical protein F5972_08175 [Microbispora cellulosiformans]|uniref:Uncharacterized protein n=1 Tax=Microbispora cellulosiformans TaxID=2614688 RepID=A0A5J5K837_9ACTN|nr:hypothetical protein [Microbispora cellulosiformans]KAA9379623.1 hypothetical protein F5972_08175 [Microbispora cellulosiformans]
MSVIIRVRPAADQRRAFAAWAITQTPKLRTVSPVEFGVPAHLFPAVPEHLLAGAFVDGRLYVAPDPVQLSGDASRGLVPPPDQEGPAELEEPAPHDQPAEPGEAAQPAEPERAAAAARRSRSRRTPRS